MNSNNLNNNYDNTKSIELVNNDKKISKNKINLNSENSKNNLNNNIYVEKHNKRKKSKINNKLFPHKKFLKNYKNNK